MTVDLALWVGGVLAALGGLLGLYLRGHGDGRRSAERTALEARVRGMEGRGDAEQAADRAEDPRADLARDWSRGRVR